MERTIPNLPADRAWHGGRRHALAWALELDDPAARLVTAARQRLGDLLLARYERQPHVTLGYAGLMGEPALPGYDTCSLSDDLSSLRPLLSGPVRVVADAWDTFAMVPYLGVAADWLHLAQQALSPSADTHRMAYRPHLTVGQYAVDVATDDVRGRLAPLPTAADWTVTQLALVRYETDDISGPLTAEGWLDLTTGRWRRATGALLAEPHDHGDDGRCHHQHYRLGQLDQ